MAKIKKSEAKAWAKEVYHGVEENVVPSFTPDLKELDEDGVRLDIRHAINQGYFSICIFPESTYVTMEEKKKFLDIAIDEAKGSGVLISTTTYFENFADQVEYMKYAENAGIDSILLSYPCNFMPSSVDNLLAVTDDLINLTEVPINLYPSNKYNLEKLFPTMRFNPEWLVPMAEHENVVALKTGNPLPDFVFECFRQVGDKILVQCPGIDLWPALVRKFNQQWSGSQSYDIYQSPKDKYAVRLFKLLEDGKYDEAMVIFHKIQPLREVWNIHFESYFFRGMYNINLWKYYQYLVGGNGGLVRQPGMRAYQYEMEMTKAAFRKVGIEISDNEEEFYVGRSNYAKGLRMQRSVS